MENGLPLLNCLLQQTLRGLCSSSDSSTSSKWVYAVFWRILPRNYPPPKWDYGATTLDRSKGNKRNWILVWEDGYCDFNQCEQAGSGYIKGRFGADVFFKMSHEVYNYGEGLVGKVASDNSHKWVFRDASNEGDPSFISSWNVSIEPQPRAWQFQYRSGIQTIAVISVREGLIQLGSFDKIMEDLNLVISIQRKFSYLQSIPGVFAIQRPYLPIQHPYIIKPNTNMIENQEANLSVYENNQSTGMKRLFSEMSEDSPSKSINFGWNTPQIPPLLPSMSYSFGTLLSKLPSVIPSYNNTTTSTNYDMATLVDNYGNNTYSTSQVMKVDGGNIKMEYCCHLDAAQEEKPNSINPPNLGLENIIMNLGFRPLREGHTQSP